MAQISKWVRPGAQRINVTGTTSPFSPLLAFKHAGLGQITIVGINTSGSATTLSGTLASLPAVPHLDLYYTSATRQPGRWRQRGGERQRDVQRDDSGRLRVYASQRGSACGDEYGAGGAGRHGHESDLAGRRRHGELCDSHQSHQRHVGHFEHQHWGRRLYTEYQLCRRRLFPFYGQCGRPAGDGGGEPDHHGGERRAHGLRPERDQRGRHELCHYADGQ